MKRNLDKDFNQLQEFLKKILFVFEILQGRMYLLSLHPGVKMEQNPSHGWPGIYIHELVQVFKWRSHSPGPIEEYEQQACLSSEQDL